VTAATAPSALGAWWLAARPKTLPVAVVPILVGCACSARVGEVRLLPAAAALAGALLLQIGSNLANDVFDYEKGADTEDRQGPTRAVQAGWIAPRTMKRAMAIVFAAALLVGIYLTSVVGPVIIAIGLASIVAAIAYTGGPFPLGYNGLGEAFVMLFFGFVAVCGTCVVNTGVVHELAVWAAVPVGALASAILVVNNVRDEQTDRRAGKRTLVVRLGRRAGVFEYAVLVFVAYATPVVLLARGMVDWPSLLPLLTFPMALRLVRAVVVREGAELNPILARTAQLSLAYGVLFSVGLLWRATPHAAT
jgi:1,4-dihydroxy-2-naphthoate octaprenyltransferase